MEKHVIPGGCGCVYPGSHQDLCSIPVPHLNDLSRSLPEFHCTSGSSLCQQDLPGEAGFAGLISDGCYTVTLWFVRTTQQFYRACRGQPLRYNDDTKGSSCARSLFPASPDCDNGLKLVCTYRNICQGLSRNRGVSCNPPVHCTGGQTRQRARTSPA